MDEITRYRVTGTVFLVAVAIIVLPMLFDGDGVPTAQIDPLTPPAELDRAELSPAEAEALQTPIDIPYEEELEAVAELTDDEGYLSDSGTLLGEPVLEVPSEDTKVWAVQTGSFASEDNARAFRDTLREAGFEAFLSTIKTEQQVMVRVAVGPYLDAAEAEGVASNIAERFTTETRLMAFSS